MAEFFPDGLMYPVRQVAGERFDVPSGLADNTYHPNSVWAASEDDVYLALPSTTSVIRWLNGEWRAESLLDRSGMGAMDTIEAITGDGTGRMWALGRRLYERTPSGQWQSVDLPADIGWVRDLWVGVDGFGVAVGDTVYTTTDAGLTWNDETRGVPFLADGMAGRRVFRQVRGYGSEAAIVTDNGELLRRVNEGWEALYLDAEAVSVGADGLAVASGSFLVVRDGDSWLAYPATRGGWGGKGGGYYRLEQVWSTAAGHVYSTGNFEGVYHRFPDGSIEFLPIVHRSTGIWANEAALILGSETGDAGFWRYDLSGAPESSGALHAAASIDDRDALPSHTDVITHAPHFEEPTCVEAMLTEGGEGIVTVISPSDEFDATVDCDSPGAYLSLRRYGFRAAATGSYRFVLEKRDVSGNLTSHGSTALRLRARCGGESLTYGSHFDAGLQEGQQVVLEVLEWFGGVHSLPETSVLQIKVL